MDITLKKHALFITGTLHLANPPTGGTPGRYTFQRVRAGFGNLPGGTGYDMQIRRTVTPADPMTPAQMARRALMAAAVARWHAMTTQDKAAFEKKAENRSITVFNAVISDTLKNWHLVDGVLVQN